MAGYAKDGDNVKDNDTIKFAFDYAQSQNSNLNAKLSNPDMRLYLSPKIMEISINNGTVYQYSYADQVYPYTGKPYPGDLSKCAKKVFTTGVLNVRAPLILYK
jgi:hypothetical protein